MRLPRVVVVALVGLVSLTLLTPFAIAPYAEGWIQGVVEHPPHEIRPEVAKLHGELVIADLHADSLLWQRDFLERSETGHVDLPRLVEGNVAVQVLGVPTKTPLGLNYHRNSGDSFDMMTLVAVSQRWPMATWGSLEARALHMARKLDGIAERAPDRVRLLHRGADVDALLAARRSGSTAVGALLAIEGAHVLEGRVGAIDTLFDAGFRMVGLQHFFDNDVGGSLHGEEKGGLTAYGREVLAALEARRIIVDVAHSSPAVVDDVLATGTRPVVVSHTGVAGVCDSGRNLADEQVRRIGAAGGLIGVGYWDGAVCDVSPAGVAKAIVHAISLVGPRQVALGSDYDGGTWTTFDTSELAVVTQALLDAGLGREELAAVMGGNLVRFLREQLP